MAVVALWGVYRACPGAVQPREDCGASQFLLLGRVRLRARIGLQNSRLKIRFTVLYTVETVVLTGRGWKIHTEGDTKC